MDSGNLITFLKSKGIEIGIYHSSKQGLEYYLITDNVSVIHDETRLKLTKISIPYLVYKTKISMLKSYENNNMVRLLAWTNTTHEPYLFNLKDLSNAFIDEDVHELQFDLTPVSNIYLFDSSYISNGVCQEGVNEDNLYIDLENVNTLFYIFDDICEHHGILLDIPDWLNTDVLEHQTKPVEEEEEEEDIDCSCEVTHNTNAAFCFMCGKSLIMLLLMFLSSGICSGIFAQQNVYMDIDTCNFKLHTINDTSIVKMYDDGMYVYYNGTHFDNTISILYVGNSLEGGFLIKKKEEDTLIISSEDGFCIENK